jgi:tetraacyldisaccharide-1-P 4'-kinase
VLLEDGHQTAAVGRHLDVVILDHWRIQPTAAGDRIAAATGRVFPLGPWRESTTGAERAAIWLLETGDTVPERGIGGARVVTFQRHLRCRGVNAGAQTEEQPHRPALVSGIARPLKFETGATASLTGEPPLAVRLADHEPYRPRLVQKIRQAMDGAGCTSLVTTAKDWIKLAPFWDAERPAYVMDLEIVWGKGETLSELVEERL